MNKEKDWTRVALYGTFDGFTYSTDGLPKAAVILDGGEKVEVPDEYVLSADKIIREDEIKLIHVLKRIKSFELGTRKVWLDEILHELGSDYGSAKYKDGYEQGKLEGEWVGQQLKDADKIRQELNKPVVPQFVADWIEEGRKHCKDVSDLFGFDFTNEEVGKWFLQEKPFDLVARAWLDGYTVEKERQYYVRFKFIEDSYSYLTLIKHLGAWTLYSITLDKKFRTEHTKKQLEDAGFGWVFNCEGIEIEEVEE